MEQPLAWAAALIAYDFLYYWSHRLSHRIGFLWANHAVHHQTRDYHLAIGFRVGVLGPLLTLPFFAPLALIGVPVAIYAGVAVIHALLMFGLHARFVGDGGRLGLVFNTPSHHRIHHSVAAEHLGTNFGGLFILWDRWFGTFAPERRVGPATEFGLPEGGRHLDPFAAQLWGWRQLGRQMKGHGVRGALIALGLVKPAAPARAAARSLPEQRAVVGVAVAAASLAPLWLETTASAALLALPVALVAPQLHKLSHQPRPAGPVRALQRARLVLGRWHHARHHGCGHDRAFCIVTGWCNPILDRLGLWRRLDAALAWRWR